MTERQVVLLYVVVGFALFLVLGVSVCLVTYTVVDTAASQELRVQVLELRTALENLTATEDSGSVDTAPPAPALLTAVADLSAKLDHVVSSLSHVQTQTQELRVAVDGLSSRVDTNSRAVSDLSDRSLGLQTTLDTLSTTVDTNSRAVSDVKDRSLGLQTTLDTLSTTVDTISRIVFEVESENALLRSEVPSVSCSQNGTDSLHLSVLSTMSPESPGRLDCQHHQRLGLPSGVYTVIPQDGQPAFPAYCDMDTEGGPWLVFQRRENGSVNFTRNWDDYTSGFGDLRGEFWLGLEKLHRLTSAGMSQLRVDLVTWEEKAGHALYSTFRVSGSSDNFRLEVHGYSGTAGDSMYSWNVAHGTANGMQFSTYDRDHDTAPASSCAQQYQAGWWYNRCGMAHPNGVYGSQGSEGAHYVSWPSLTNYELKSLKFVEMKMK